MKVLEIEKRDLDKELSHMKKDLDALKVKRANLFAKCSKFSTIKQITKEILLKLGSPEEG